MVAFFHFSVVGAARDVETDPGSLSPEENELSLLVFVQRRLSLVFIHLSEDEVDPSTESAFPLHLLKSAGHAYEALTSDVFARL